MCVCVGGRGGFPSGSVVKNLPVMQETQVQSLDQKDPLEKEMANTPVFMPGESHLQRSLTDYSPWVTKSRTRLEQPCMQARMHVLHCSLLALE